MDHRGQRPPRAARPPGGQPAQPAPSPPSYPAYPTAYPDQPATTYRSGHSQPQYPQYQQHQQQQQHHQQQQYYSQQQYPQQPGRGISFQNIETGERREPLDQTRHRQYSAYQSATSPPPMDVEGGFSDGRVGRKKSLVRPDREKVDPNHRQWHYRQRAAEMGDALPSTTGNAPTRGQLRRGKSLLGREEDVHESGLALFKRGTLRRKRSSAAVPPEGPKSRDGCLGNIGPGPKDAWYIYCYIATCWVPSFFLSACGIRTPEQQRAWREKIGLLLIIISLMAIVGFITFGFTEVVCGTQPNRFQSGQIDTASVIIHGYDYDFSKFNHPAVGDFNGKTNPLFVGNWGASGADISFMFQNVNKNCLGLITKTNTSSITGNNNQLDWYFPCNIYNQFGTSPVNTTNSDKDTTCHITSTARNDLAALRPQGQVYYTWDNVHNSARNLAVFESTVLDLDLLNWLDNTQVSYPSLFDKLKQGDGTFNGRDLSMYFLRTAQRPIGRCLQDIVTVGYIDTNSIGCVASEVVLYVSLVFIIGVVGIRFVMAVLFAWFFSWKLGNFERESYAERMRRAAEIENWTDDIYRPAPSRYRPNVQKNGLAKGGEKRKTFFPSTSRFTPSENAITGVSGRPTTAYGMLEPPKSRSGVASVYSSARSLKPSPPDTPFGQSRSSTSLVNDPRLFADNPCPFPLHNVVEQPPPDFQPFNYPLVHTICLVTAYSESVEGLRTTLDSLATTNYPNSHKLIMIIADGMVKGAGNALTTPEICLTMMKQFVIPPSEVQPHSYVAIADGHKRHNMAKVYAGFYAYDNSTVEGSKQQRVPVVLVAKRDSQIMLMSFMQKVMFDERMTTFEYEFFNSIWRATGVSPDRYELVLCVDADTKVFPDSLSRMVSCMVNDYEIMGLCGETKIANKAETWVTMIQVFEYYISHHLNKAFESMFGGVTCLPGCFSMYRIKAPKGDQGYWVPVLANPDVVEHYSENKNLLLLGEDRYLTTLMLKTFPKRKNVFCPQAVCKTVVPDTFRVLLSQRRRWINSTIHNLAELLLVRDLCGTFCFSMQFVVGMELAGTLVLPAAISFTIYLIVSSIIPGGPDTTIPLILLAIVLGLPGLLIVITSRKIAYVGWMLVYLLSLPIWNGTRQVAGEGKDADHGDKEGEFDSSHIVMKRWAEFERDRRHQPALPRDSYDPPKRPDGHRYSMVSTPEYSPQQFDQSTYESSYASSPRPRHDSSGQVLMLPTPLSVGRPGAAQTPSVSTVALSRSSEEGGYTSDVGSHQRLSGGVLRQSTMSAQYPREMQNPYSYSPQSAGFDDQTTTPFVGEPEEVSALPSNRQRGISCVRRVSRQQGRRPTSQAPPPQNPNRYSRNFSLPPGAAPPQQGGNGGYGY
ncbi:chitin synthase-domain-containing protein [Epithele typhae]|uniref:chitin synthase-domain-containing protein n=2 Tax=Epithele typhae TaxID=378194 RepID=UPI0020080221|nr:chitin synthase-domain-containing protein [Epithele typhae]KAH9934076.1 chitin synthase-domain-containing protein [Epithele typhae]